MLCVKVVMSITALHYRKVVEKYFIFLATEAGKYYLP